MKKGQTCIRSSWDWVSCVLLWGCTSCKHWVFILYVIVHSWTEVRLWKQLNQEAGLPNLHMKSAGEKSQVEVISEGRAVTWLIGSAYNGQSFTSIHQLTRRRYWQFPKVWATGLLNMAVFMLTHIHSGFPALPTGEDCPVPRMLR